MALIAYNKGDLTRAIQHYKHVFSNNPSAKEAESALLGLQEIYITDLGKSDEYVTYINSLPGYKVTESAADSLAFMVGAMRYNEGEYDKAIAGFSNYLDKYPNGFNKVHAIYYRAESYALVKNYGSALDDYETLAAMGNSEFYIPSLRKSALISYNYTQAFDKALKYYDLYYNNITDVNEKYSAALGALRSAFRTADLASVEKYGKIVLQYPTASTDDKAVAAYYLGKVYLRENKLQEALDAFTQVEKLAENNQAAESRYLIAEILYKQDKKVEAEAQCNKANEANAAYPYWIAKSLLLLSNIYVERNDLFNARAALEVIIEHFPDNEELKKEASEQLIIVEQLEKQNSRIKPGSKDSPMLELQNPEK
ncbi:MAG: Tetratricopeptide repeat protein [Bacteroidetes bacterium OLB9]|nr:MAG: Tetratricopeptide repeat protein [Bacteroidetes bacterium OLB9]